MTPPSPQGPVLDWAAYWRAFQDVHGGDPVPFRGRLLFRDGWTHSATDHAGPEWPPPRDPRELKLLRQAYWLTQRARARRAVAEARDRLHAAEDLQRAKSAPLMVRVEVRGEDGVRSVKHLPLDLTPLRAERSHLEDVLAEAELELEALGLPEPAAAPPPVRWADDLPPSAVGAQGIGPREPRDEQGVT